MTARSLYRFSTHAGALGALVLCAGCGAAPTAPPDPQLVAARETTKVSTTEVTSTPVVVPEAPPPPVAEPEPAPEPRGDSISASASLRQLCGISDAEGYAHFDVNSAAIKSGGNDVISKVAACVKDGKLGERKLQIIGFTDPRGTDEHNMKLGRDRANSAKSRLMNLGVTANKVMTESRGETEAKGTDETSWAFDRRVEMHLDNESPESTGVNSGSSSPTR